MCANNCTMKAVRSQIKLGSLILLAFGSMISSFSCTVRAVSVQVNRTSNDSPDSFTYTSLDSDIHLAGQTCADFSATFAAEDCRLGEQQCTCICNEKTPTFIAHLGTCVEDEEVRGLFHSLPARHYDGRFHEHRWSCPPKRLPSIETEKLRNAQRLAFCNGAGHRVLDTAYNDIMGCNVTGVKYLNESTYGTFVKEQGTSVFKILIRKQWGIKYPSLEWDAIGSGSHLVGATASIDIECKFRRVLLAWITSYGRLLAKIAGSKRWDLPSLEVSTACPSTDVTRLSATARLPTADDHTKSLSSLNTISTSAMHTATKRFKTLEATPVDKGYRVATTVVSLPWQQSLPFVETAATTLSIDGDVTESLSLNTPVISTSAMLSVLESTPTESRVYVLGATTSFWLPYMKTVPSVAGSDTRISRKAFGPTRKAATLMSRSVHGVGTPETQTTGNGSNLTTVLSVTGGLSFAVLIGVSIFLVVRRQDSRRSEARKRAEKSSTLNPIYGKGADSIMMSVELNTAYTNEDSHTYQAIVQNTREPSDCPTYASLQRDSHKQPPAQDQSIYQALRTNSPREIQQEDQYQPLSRQSSHLPDEAIKEDTRNREENRGTETEYVVLEGPSEDTPGVTGPIYQVLEEGEGQGATHEDTTPEEPVYNVLEAD